MLFTGQLITIFLNSKSFQVYAEEAAKSAFKHLYKCELDNCYYRSYFNAIYRTGNTYNFEQQKFSSLCGRSGLKYP